jgi:hypothetical protein
LIQIRKWKTAARKEDRERKPVWQRSETVRSFIEKRQERAAESRKASGHQILDRGLINSRASNFSLRHRIPDRSWRLSRLLHKEFRKSNGKGFNPINYRLSAPKSRMCVKLGLINLQTIHLRFAFSTIRSTIYSIQTQ